MASNPQVIEDIQVWLEGAEFERLCGHIYSELRVLKYSSQRFLSWLDDMDFEGIELRIGHMNWLRERLDPSASENAIWAKIFMDNWFVSSFSLESWRRLVELDASNIGMAAEAAFFGMKCSGAGGLSELIELIFETNTLDKLHEYSETYSADSPNFKQWTSHIFALLD